MSKHRIGFRRRLLLLTLLLCGAALATWSLSALAFRSADHDIAIPTPVPKSNSILTISPAPTPIPTPTPVPPFEFSQSAPQTALAADDYFDDAVFLGDSRSDGLRLYSGIRRADFLAYKALTVFEVTGTYGIQQKKIPVGDQKKTVLSALDEKQYNKVYMMFGINELGWNRSSDFKAAFGRLIDEVRLRQPNAILYIESLIPVNPEKCLSSKAPYYITNDKIVVFNELLQQVAAEKGVVYLDLGGALSDENGALPAEATVDGIHFVKSYYVKWFDYLKIHTVDKAAYDAGQITVKEETPHA